MQTSVSIPIALIQYIRLIGGTAGSDAYCVRPSVSTVIGRREFVDESRRSGGNVLHHVLLTAKHALRLLRLVQTRATSRT